MNLYNTRSRAIEEFHPRAGSISLYVCGITPYDTTHLGHAFTYTAADVLVRYLESQGLTVRYVQNVTDIDDDIVRKAREVGEDWRTLGDRWTAHFIRDMQALNVRPPDAYPRASDVIPEIVEAVRALIARGLAYQSGGSVYFHVDAWPEFGQLGQLTRAEMLSVANERGNRPHDPNKRNPLDFVLWQAQAPGEPAWKSPWGPGRPGWHIECSVMSMQFLGKTIDIHGGGEDLAFPHHECEIAQVEPVTGAKPFVRVWLHAAMVEHEGAKMSKSLGNLVMVSDLLRRWPADSVRLYLSRHHYRRPWSHNVDELTEADRLAGKLRAAATVRGGGGEMLDAGIAQKAFTAAMDDDLDTGAALARLEALADSIQAAARAGRELGPAQAVLRKLGQVFGLRLDATEVESRVVEGWSAHLRRFASD